MGERHCVLYGLCSTRSNTHQPNVSAHIWKRLRSWAQPKYPESVQLHRVPLSSISSPKVSATWFPIPGAGDNLHRRNSDNILNFKVLGVMGHGHGIPWEPKSSPDMFMGNGWHNNKRCFICAGDKGRPFKKLKTSAKFVRNFSLLCWFLDQILLYC